MAMRCSYDGTLPAAAAKPRRPSLRRRLSANARAWPLRLAALVLLAAVPAAVPADAGSNRPIAAKMLAGLSQEELQARWQEGKAAVEQGDIATAMAFWLPLAELGLANAQADIGYIYLAGLAGKPDLVRAEKWLKAAADRGILEAQYNLGTLLEARVIRGAAQQAAQLYRRAAERGHTEAQLQLADMLADGRGTAANDVEAAAWYTRAAELGNAVAQARLGTVYLHGRGVPQDYEAAASWLQRAASRGEASAQGQLGALYMSGRGVPQDYVAAHQWFNLSAANARDNDLRQRSAAHRDLAAARMSPDAVAEAQRRARDWKSKT